ncbi:unnamed protein product [Mesocestoides corti]|uniref:Uncharacterized protein n=1 Tax=Mesocestoides corti TaxID=53468 RepID=A0A0R3UQN8_MESCO|nr:unnamed protein product [Mesocestoides corti]
MTTPTAHTQFYHSLVKTTTLHRHLGGFSTTLTYNTSLEPFHGTSNPLHRLPNIAETRVTKSVHAAISDGFLNHLLSCTALIADDNTSQLVIVERVRTPRFHAAHRSRATSQPYHQNESTQRRLCKHHASSHMHS